MLFVFFRGKQYRHSYFPIIILLYVFSIILEIYAGRSAQFGVEVMKSSRYTIDTRLFLVADVWILIRMVMDSDTSGKAKKIKKLVVAGTIIVVLAVLTLANVNEYKIGPYRKIYCDNLIDTIQNIDEASDEDLTLFASDPATVREGVKIMKKYNLGVFQYSNGENETQIP